jgi:hypothetical protein
MSYILTRPNLKELEPLKFFVMRGGDTLYGHLTVSHGPTETAANDVAVDQH